MEKYVIAMPVVIFLLTVKAVPEMRKNQDYENVNLCGTNLYLITTQ